MEELPRFMSLEKHKTKLIHEVFAGYLATCPWRKEVHAARAVVLFNSLLDCEQKSMVLAFKQQNGRLWLYVEENIGIYEIEELVWDVFERVKKEFPFLMGMKYTFQRASFFSNFKSKT